MLNNTLLPTTNASAPFRTRSTKATSISPSVLAPKTSRGVRTPMGANLPALSARPATDGGDALIMAPISRFRIDPGRDAPRVVVSPAIPHHASLVLRRGRHAVPVLADLLIAGA